MEAAARIFLDSNQVQIFFQTMSESLHLLELCASVTSVQRYRGNAQHIKVLILIEWIIEAWLAVLSKAEGDCSVEIRSVFKKKRI